MICSKCGQRVSDSVKFCPHCGNYFKGKSEMPCGIPKEKKSGCGRIFLGVIAVIFGCGALGGFVENTSKNNSDRDAASTGTSTRQAPVAEPVKAQPYKAEISPNAVPKYPETATELKKKGFPVMLQKYGVEGIKKINRLLPKVAEKASLNKSMDKIVYVDVSDNRSTKDKLVFFVDAANSNRLYISESELDGDKTVLSDQEILRKLLPVHELMCEKLIKASLTYPSTYDKHIFDSISVTQEYTNVIRIAFSAKNAYNLEIDYVAIFRVNAQSEVVYQDIREKQ